MIKKYIYDNIYKGKKKKMKKKGKVFRNALIFIILIALTFYILLKDQNPMEILKIISSAKVEFVLIGILCMFIYIVL